MTQKCIAPVRSRRDHFLTMIQVSQERLAAVEAVYPGFLESLAFFESLELPPCAHCGSPNTAAVQAGVIGRTINLSAAATKFHLTPNGSDEGSLWCRACRRYFGPLGQFESERYRPKAG